MPTQEHRLSIGWNTQFNGVESGLPALHAHTRYTVGVQLCLGDGYNPNLQIGAIYSHAEAIKSAAMKALGLCPFELSQGGRPRAPLLVHVLVQGHSETPWIFLPKVCSAHLPIFTLLKNDNSPWESCRFSSKWNCLWCLKASTAINC